MYTACDCKSVILLLLSNALLAVISAVIPPTADYSSTISTPTDGNLQQQNSTQWSSSPLLTPINTTSPSLSVPTIVPLPGTEIYLRITYIGESWFATSLLESLFASAHEKIRETVSWHPNEPVRPLPWFHSLYSKEWRDTIAIRIRGNQGKVFTWLQLEWVLAGLLRFMEGEPRQLHPVNFDVNVVEQGIVAAGVLWYSQGPPPRAMGAESGAGWGDQRETS